MQQSVARKWGRRLLVAGAATGLTAAASVGGFRLLVTSLPSYQTRLQAWVTESLGLNLEFSRIDARWSWRGPEITFHDARVGAQDQTLPFVTARQARVGVSPFGLVAQWLLGRMPTIDRLTLEGTELTLVHGADGALMLQGAPGGVAARSGLALDVPPDVEVVVRDSRVIYHDRQRDRAWDFHDVTASMTRDTDMLSLEATAEPPAELGGRFTLTAQSPIDDSAGQPALVGDWRVFAEVRNVDLAVVGRALPANVPAGPQAGRGDVSVWLAMKGGVLESVTADLALDDVVLPRVRGAAGARYERIAFTGDWERRDGGFRLALNDVAVARAGRVWPAGVRIAIELDRDADGPSGLRVQSDFVRLEDVTPLFAPFARSRLLDAWFGLAPRGDLTEANAALLRAGSGWELSVSAAAAGLSFEPFEGYPGVTNLSGEVRADSRSGRVELHSRDATLAWPALFRAPLPLTEVAGTVVWRRGQDAVRLVTDDLVVANADGTARTSLELALPLDGGSPRLDLTANVEDFPVVAAKRYLPARKLPYGIVSWLDRALVGGVVRDARITFVGPLRAFPFDGGEGEFRAAVNVEDGALAYLDGWPAAEDLDGVIEFANAGFTGRGSGRTLGNRSANVRAAMADVRDPVLTLQAQTIGPLDQVVAYLQGAPLIARYLGPDLARISAPFGTGEAGIDLRLPIKRLGEFELTGTLDMIDAELSFAGFAHRFTEIDGRLTLADGKISGEGIEAIFLDGPLTARIASSEAPGYRAQLDVEGEVALDAVARAFELPEPARFAGQTRWQGSLSIPAPGEAPARITIGSNLSGAALRFPEPLAKAPSDAINLQIGLDFLRDGGLEASGNLGATRRFAIQLAPSATEDGRFEFRRAALRFGGAQPVFRAERGITVDGSLAKLPLDEWLALAPSAGGNGAWGAMFAGATLDIAEFSAFGQELGASRVGVRRRTDDWQIDVDSGAIAGTVLVPARLDADRQVIAVMQRLYLNAGESGSMRRLDPRKLPGLQLHADAFALGSSRLGKLDAEILSDPLGLRLVSFETVSPSFAAQGSGAWFKGDGGDTTRFAVSLTSSDAARLLRDLGFDPVIEAERAEVTASVYWPGPPAGNWMDHVSGDLALSAETGSLLDVEPGAGRMLGLMSFMALPRRLALDFRDVVNKGFVFDDITADFVLVDGNAYTDNLKLTGPAADIGVVGRTGLRDRDYRQQAVVTSEPGKMLPTVGLLGGPQVAAALLIFTRIFKKPLQGIGRASYCVTGTWGEPVVERLTPEALGRGALCAELPPGTMPPEGIAAR